MNGSRRHLRLIARPLGLGLVSVVALPAIVKAQPMFKRGDFDGDEAVTASDFALFQREFGKQIFVLDPPCQKAWDINDDGSDFIGLPNYAAFVTGMAAPETLPAPGGVDWVWIRQSIHSRVSATRPVE